LPAIFASGISVRALTRTISAESGRRLQIARYKLRCNGPILGSSFNRLKTSGETNPSFISLS
jgi:hypothetical protein